MPGAAVLSGEHIALTIGEAPINITGRRRTATAVNGQVPGPTLRLREGDNVTIDVTNRLSEPTSIHWHGFRLPNPMDGVPGLTFPGIMPGETFTYRFPIVQNGTYWYHSHSGMQEQTGLYGPVILEPKSPRSVAFAREYVVVLSDWTDEDPMTVVANLKQQGDYYNFHQRTLGTFVADNQRKGLKATLADWSMWGRMRMSPTDIMDVTGATYTFLVNGRPPAANWTALFAPGERVLLRFINSAAMSTFDVRIPGLPLSVVAADGSDVEAVAIDQFRIGVAETYDVIVTPSADQAYTIFAQAEDRTGYARATLAPRRGMSAAVPPMDPRPLRTMADMGMAGMAAGGDKMSGAGMAGMNMGGAPKPADGMAGMDMGTAPAASAGPAMPSGADMAGMDMSGGAKAGGDMAGMDMSEGAAATAPATNADHVDPQKLPGQVNVDNVAMETQDRQGEPGAGLAEGTRKTLTYADLKSLEPGQDPPPAGRDIEFHLTGNMQRWTWGFDGKKFSQAAPIYVRLGETVRFVLINDTMMEHPINLHGFLFSLENGNTGRLPLKHTVNVKPGERVGIVFTADTPGRWAFHCHLLYHMETGMFRTVLVA